MKAGAVKSGKGGAMFKEAERNKPNKVKQFFSQLINKIDKKMEAKAKSQGCCKAPDKKGNSCCS